MPVEFLTLLLGLVAGPQVIEVAVGAEVAEVRLLLDGEPEPRSTRRWPPPANAFAG